MTCPGWSGVLRPLGLSIFVWAWLSVLAGAAEPPAEPVLRIESSMHTAAIWRIATDAANRFLVTGSDDKTARIWDLESGRLLRILRPPLGPGNEGRIYAVAMSPDGATVACGGWTGYDWDKRSSIYLFDRAMGRLIRRISGVPGVINHLAWSPDGSQLGAVLSGGNGVRVFRVQDGAEVGADGAYGDDGHSADFHRAGKLVTTSYDGQIRLYRVSERALTLIQKRATPGGALPYSARFSPDGSRIAVGYNNVTRVDVLSGDTLGDLYSADTQGVNNGDLRQVAWSANGSQLYAGGKYDVRGLSAIRVWAEAGRGAFTELLAAPDTIGQIVSLKSGGLVFGSADPMFGVFDAAGRKVLEQRPVVADFRDDHEGFKVSRDATAIRFGFAVSGRSPARFDLGDRRLLPDPPSDASLASPVTSAPDLDIQNWQDTYKPTLNGKPLGLQQHERARSVAIAPDRGSFVLGSEWYLRRFDRQGKERWKVEIPSVAWSVNISGDGRFVVAAFGDGTIRWYRLSDGVEVLALFAHADRKRWVIWSPSGYYDASPGAEDLIGWHVNRGKDAAADFYPASRFRATFYRPDVVAKVLETTDELAALRLANEDAGRKAQTVDIAKALPPVVQIAAPTDGAAVTTPDVRVRFTVRTAADAPVTGVRARVNGQAVALPEARTIAVAPASGAAQELSVPIPPRDSEIMLFVENRHGVSVPAVLRVIWRGAVAAAPGTGGDFVVKPKLYLLAVGVADYRDRELKLQYAAKDARDFARAMQGQKGGLYRDVEVKVLTDPDATRDNVVDGLEWLQREVTAKDVGMLFLAGHGVTDPFGIYYYLPVNADVDRLKRTGVPFSEIRNTLGALAGKAVFFVDTCHSGNVMGTRRAGPPDITAVVNELASAENGVVVFASSTGRQYSLESPEWNNGAFTKALIEGVNGKADLRNTGRITHKMLDFYVAERVKELTKGRQTPVSPSPEGVADFPIATVLRSR